MFAILLRETMSLATDLMVSDFPANVAKEKNVPSNHPYTEKTKEVNISSYILVSLTSSLVTPIEK